MEKDLKSIENIAIICPDRSPVPAVNGGAVESLIELLINENENNGNVVFHVYSYYNSKANEESKRYKYTIFHYLKPSLASSLVDFYGRFVFRVSSYKAKRASAITSFFKRENKKNNIKKVLIEGFIPQVLNLPKDLRIFLHVHAEWVGLQKMNPARFFKPIYRLISVSDYISKTLLAYCEKERHAVVKNSIDTTIFCKPTITPFDMRQKFRIPDGAFVFLYAARINEGKGTLECVRAFNNLNSKNAYLLICGATWFKGSKPSAYERLVRDEASKNPNIVFTGFIPHQELPNYYYMSNVFVSPSKCNDAANLSNIEAGCCGLPIITTNRGGIPEYVVLESTILLNADFELEKQLESSMNDIINNWQSFKEKAENSKTIYNKTYSSSEYYKKMIKILL